MEKRLFILVIFGLLFLSLHAQNTIEQKLDTEKSTLPFNKKPDQTNQVAKATKQTNNYILPFIEYFDNGSVPPTDWISFRGTNDEGTDFDWGISSNGGYENDGAMVRWENQGGTTLEDWLVSPMITLGLNTTLAYFEKQDYTTEYWSNYTIRISTNSQSTHADFTTILSYGESDFSTSYTQREIDLSAYDGLDVYIAFVMTNDDGDSWYIDNMVVEEGSATSDGKLVISEVAYPVNESEGRFIELYNAGNTTIDLSRYFLGFYRNTQRIDLVGTIDPDEKFIYTPNASDFSNTYGFAADQADGGIDPSWFSGTDAIILLYQKNKAAYQRLDTYGVIRADGTGTEWEYTDKHAVRKADIKEDQNPMISDEWIVSSAYASVYFDVTPGSHNEYYYWNGNNDGDWDNYENWTVAKGSAFIPDAGAKVVIPSGSSNSPNLAYYRFPYFFNSLTIQPGANFTMSSNNILKVTHDVTIASGASLTLDSDAAGSATFIPEGTVSGETNAKRYMATISGTTGNGIWHLFSSPVSDFQTGSLIDQYLKYWDEPNANWGYISSTNESLTAGKGYALLLLNDYGNTVNMTGSLNTGDITVPNLDFTSGTSWEGYNLVGNPYTASIDWDIIQSSLPTEIDQAIYYWDVENDQYIYYNNGSGTASRFIPAGQAFFIHVTAANQQITFTQDSRAADSSHIYYKSAKGKTYDNYIPETKTPTNQLIVETSTNYGTADKVFLKFHEKASTDYDGEFDAIKFYSNNDEIADAWLTFQGTEYSINTLPIDMIDGRYDMTIRFGKQASYSLIFDGIDSFEKDQPINLYDKTTSKYYDLRKHYKLNFYNSNDVIEDRFQLVFSPGVGVIENIEDYDNWLIYSDEGSLNIRNTLNTNETKTFTYQIYTIDGKLIASHDKVNEVIKKQFNVSSGIYLVKLNTTKQQIMKKVWLSE